jgi:uncharacterized protein
MAWDERKRLANVAKHGLDFADAGEVLESRYRLDIPVLRAGEWRVLSISYALGFLAVLAVVHVNRGGRVRIISFRPASAKEREYDDHWLENECDEP